MQNAASGPDRAAGQGSIRVDSRFGTGANWRPLAADYYRHHFGCKTCISAGRGHGQRCTAGADLWAAYEAAAEADHHDTSRTTRRRQT